MTERDLYSIKGLKAGCPPLQVARLAEAGVFLHERQLVACAAARMCDLADGPTGVGYGGARGGGKSHWLLAQMGVDDCQRVAGLKCLLLRKVGKANLEHFEDLRRKLFNELPHEFSAFRGILTFGNGSRIIAGHFQAEKDIDAYLGLEYDIIGIEEATTLTARKYQDITTCCRSSKVLADGHQWRPRIYSTTNPGGVGHAWYRAKFVAPMLAGKEKETRFIPARVTDNKWNNPDYVRVLEGLTGWQKRAWLNGDWDIAAGQYFTNFRREIHVISDFDISRGREFFCALDYGFAHYTVVLLGCRDGDGNTFVVDEHAERMWLPQRHAVAIKAMLARHKLQLADVRRFSAGADVFSRQGDGSTIAQAYDRCGIRLKVANMDRLNGWAEVMGGFGDPEAGIRPKLFIHERCKRLVESLPSLQHDPNRPEDVLKVDTDEEGVGGDDAADCLRYLVATKTRSGRIVRIRGF
ncbi:MAG: hypothetical protein WCH99_12320 [Verrucomicrobiota bacterium]